MSSALAIVSVGMCCSVGLDAPQTASSIRAGVTRKPETPFLDLEGQPIRVGHLREELLPPLVDGLRTRAPVAGLEARLLRLGGRALGEALGGPLARLGPALLLAGPRPREDEPAPMSTSFAAQLATQAGVGLDLCASQLFTVGSAGLFAAALAARERLDVGAAADLIVVGGVDSFFCGPRLARLEQRGRLRTSGPQDALTPGEGAGFVVLATEPGCRRHGLSPLAWITHVATEPAAGGRRTALARACAAVLDAPGPEPAPPVDLVMAGLTGESSSGREWGVAALRNRERLDPQLHIEHPAEFIGDAGAGLAPIMLASAALWLRAGKHEGPALVWAGSGDEDRGALLMYAGARG